MKYIKYILTLLLFLVHLSSSGQYLLAFGTSIDRGAGATHPDSSWIGLLRGAFYPRQVINMAISGSTYMDSIPTSMWAALYSAKNQSLDPTYVLLGGGFNDSKFNPQNRFSREYRRFLDSVRVFWPNAEIICNTPIKCRNYPQYAAILESVIVPVTIEEGYAAGARICNLYQLPSSVAGPDGVHPNNRGYRIMFKAWYAWFLGVSVKEERHPSQSNTTIQLRIGGGLLNKPIYRDEF